MWRDQPTIPIAPLAPLRPVQWPQAHSFLVNTLNCHRVSFTWETCGSGKKLNFSSLRYNVLFSFNRIKRKICGEKIFSFNWRHLSFNCLSRRDKGILRTVTGTVSYAEILTILLWLWYFVTMRAQSWTFASLFPTCHTSHYLSQSAPC